MASLSLGEPLGIRLLSCPFLAPPPSCKLPPPWALGRGLPAEGASRRGIPAGGHGLLQELAGVVAGAPLLPAVSPVALSFILM